jgi:uncharacterized protein (DUF924 family)
MKPRQPEASTAGKPSPTAPWRFCFCSISFRATCSAARRAPLRLMRARASAERALQRRFDRRFAQPEQRFFYPPFMHSEALADQERCLALCSLADDPEGVRYAEIHADIIRRFGRFPHRNAALGRSTTADEQTFLDSGGFVG